MALDDKLRQLDERAAGAVRRAVEEVQQQVAEQLDRLGTELKALTSIRPNLPETFFDSTDLEAELRQVAGESGADNRRAALQGLRRDLATLDRCGRQKELLDTLVDRATQYAGRVAIFLLRDGTASGWGASGFDIDADAVRQLSFDSGDDSPLGRLPEAAACLDLSAAECATLCSHLEGAIPEHGVLIPLVLRDQVAAALYADQPKDSSTAFEPAALQTLTHVACLSLESLAFRERSVTATLVGLDPDLHVEEAEATSQTPAVVTESTQHDAPAAEDAGTEADEEIEATAEAEIEVKAEAEAEESEDADAPELEAAAEATDKDLGDDEQIATAKPGRFATTYVSTLNPPQNLVQEAPADAQDAAEVEVDIEVEVEVEEEVEEEDNAFSQTAEIHSDQVAGLELEAETGTGSDSGVGGYEDFDEASVEEAPELAAEETPGIPWKTAGESTPATPAPLPQLPQDADPDATMLLNRPRPVAAAPSPATPEPPAPPVAAAASSGQVQPPEDLDGPGWAFSATSEPVAENDEAVHDEARRLARLLVSEIQLYNQDDVEIGRRNNDVYERLKEDIDRSRQMYDERVDPSVREFKDYFYEELVRVLAAGDPQALGI